MQERSFIEQFFAGVSYPFRGLRLILSSKGVFTLTILPFLLTLVIYIGALTALIMLSDNVANLVIDPGTWWRTVIRWIIMISLPLILAAILVFTYAFVSLIVAAPFYEFMSAAVERKVTGEVEEEAFSFKNLAVDTSRAVTYSVIILIIEMIVLVFALVLVPVSTVICIMLSGVLMALETLDPVMGRRRMKFRERIRFVGRNFWPVLGFGLMLFVGLLIPLLGVVFLPMGVAGGTALFCDIESKTQSHS